MIKCNLRILLAKRRVEMRPPWTLTDLSKMSGISWSSVSRLSNNRTTRYDARVLDSLCKTLEVGVGDILVRVSDQDGDG